MENQVTQSLICTETEPPKTSPLGQPEANGIFINNGTDGTQDDSILDSEQRLNNGADGTQDDSILDSEQRLNNEIDGTQDDSILDSEQSLNNGIDGTQDDSILDSEQRLNNGIDGTQDDSILDSEQRLKKKRGRPTSLAPSTQSSFKRNRGRPQGSGNLQILASYGGDVMKTAGGSFTPHVFTVKLGEDVIQRILTFCQNYPRAVCVLSAIGAVSSVTFRKPGSSNVALRHEGSYDIISLTGSYILEGLGSRPTNGMLTVSLAEPNGRVFGGINVSSLIAASPIQLIIASFKQNIGKEVMRRNSTGSAAAAHIQSSNPDLERVPLKVRRRVARKQSRFSPTSELMRTTNRQKENVVPATTNGVSVNVVNVPKKCWNMNSASVNSVDMDPLQPPVMDQRISAEENTIVKSSSGQLQK